MRKLILFMHTSLDGFVAGPNGEMDWINADDDMFDYAGKQTDEADTALYGRVTYDMMNTYWPTAGEQPNASKHDKQHSAWYNSVLKVVISKTMKGSNIDNTQIISDHIPEEIKKLKQQPGKNIVIFGSPSASYPLTQNNLIDEYWLFVNPVLLGKGIPLFKNINDKKDLLLIESKIFSSGVVMLQYGK
ncbi:MAG: dihydrofolate reductase [Fimbriimonadaceae bacterium]|nr:dihydrofolate reductase [Chitinophagales bacterium]